jgi:hypothetical protein
MAGFDDSNLGGLILNVYSKDAIQRLQNLESPLLSSIKNAPSFTVGGNGFLFGANVEGNEAIGFRDSNQALPTAGKENVQQATVNPRSFYATVGVTGLAKALATGNPTSFANVISYSLDQVMDRSTAYLEGALFRDNTGRLARVNEASPSGTTLTIDSPGALWLRAGMTVDFVADAGTLSASAKITDVDWAASTIVTDSDVSGSLTDNDGIFMTGTQPAGGSILAREFDGLAAGTSASGTYLNISRSSFPRWEGNSIAASGAIDEDVLYQAFTRVAQEGGLSKSSLRGFKVIAHTNQVRKFAEVAYPRQRFSGTSTDLGVTSMSWNGHEIMDVPFCPETTVYALDMSVFSKFVTANGDLQISTDFGQPWKFVPGFDSGQAYLRTYCNYVVRNPRKAVAITGLTDVTSR